MNLPSPDVPLPLVPSGAVTGVSDRVRGDQGATTPWLAAGAARAALKASGVEAGEIQLVVVGTTSPDVLWPATACLVQTELGLPRVASFDLYAAEAGLLTALAVADRFVRSGTGAALVIGAETERQLVDLPRRTDGARHGRAAAAIVLTAGADETGILGSVVGGQPAGGRHAASGQIQAAVDACLERAGLKLGTVDLVIAEQTAPAAMRGWAAQAGITAERLLLDPQRYAGAFVVAPFVALYDAALEGRLRPGMTALLLSCGQGPAWAAACLRWGTAGLARC